MEKFYFITGKSFLIFLSIVFYFWIGWIVINPISSFFAYSQKTLVFYKRVFWYILGILVGVYIHRLFF